MRQEEVQYAPMVPVRWLVDYISMLRATLAVEIDADASDADKAKAKKADALIVKRINAIQSYLDRLEQRTLN